MENLRIPKKLITLIIILIIILYYGYGSTNIAI
jgi:hypothetical protein